MSTIDEEEGVVIQMCDKSLILLEKVEVGQYISGGWAIYKWKDT